MSPQAILATVSGIDGSGKSEFARRLRMCCLAAGASVTSLAVDDYRRTVDWNQPGRAEVDIYYDDYFDWARLDRDVLSAMAAAQDSTNGALVLVEGILVRRVPSLAKAFSIYLETSCPVARARIIARALTRGLTQSEAEHRIDQRYFPAQERYLATFTPARAADVVIDNDDYAAPRLLLGVPDAWPAILRLPLSQMLGIG